MYSSVPNKRPGTLIRHTSMENSFSPLNVENSFSPLSVENLFSPLVWKTCKLVHDRTRLFAVLYGAEQYGIFSGRTRTRTAVRRTFSI